MFQSYRLLGFYRFPDYLRKTEIYFLTLYKTLRLLIKTSLTTYSLKKFPRSGVNTR